MGMSKPLLQYSFSLADFGHMIIMYHYILSPIGLKSITSLRTNSQKWTKDLFPAALLLHMEKKKLFAGV